FAMVKDIRVIMIKLADRLHNMRTLEFLPKPEKQKRIANETFEIYVPLASRLGLSYIKCELEDSYLKYLDPELYADIYQRVKTVREGDERRVRVDTIVEQLKIMLETLGIKGEVSSRVKHLYSIYKKMQKLDLGVDQIYDLTAVRVIVPTVADCFSVLSYLHSFWRPIPGRMKDYINSPKANNYQSLHTTIMSNTGMPFEIQIRTKSMHQIAEYGIAAHWIYKEEHGKTNLDKDIAWLKNIAEADMPSSISPQDFYNLIKHDLFGTQVYIYTPKGEVKVLPTNSTPIDFAYSLHSALGDSCVGAKVNNKMVALDTRLNSGDYVEIITADNSVGASHGPNREWLRSAVTSLAKSRIRAFFNRLITDENIKKGKEVLSLMAKRQEVEFSKITKPEVLDVVLPKFYFLSADDMFASIGNNDSSAVQVFSKLVAVFKQSEVQKAKLEKIIGEIDPSGEFIDDDIIVKGHNDISVKVAKCCDPVPGDEIIAYIPSNNKKCVVHRCDCETIISRVKKDLDIAVKLENDVSNDVSTVNKRPKDSADFNGESIKKMSEKEKEKLKLYEAGWKKGRAKNSFSATITMESTNSAGVLAAVTGLIAKESLMIYNLHAKSHKKGEAIIVVRLEFFDASLIEPLIKKLSELSQIKRVYRGTGKFNS
ncbi:MAG: RelA/SpoT family protein, partial [Firmicutes bacterium]|nr:RelA/SpoT family protein [Bacillota bacterium]